MLAFVGLAAGAAWAAPAPEEDALASMLTSPPLLARRLQEYTPPPPSPPRPSRPPPDLSQPFRPSFIALIIGSPLTIALVTTAWPDDTPSFALRPCPVPGARAAQAPCSCCASSGAVGGSGRLDTPNSLTLAPAPTPNSNQCLWWCHFGRCSGYWCSLCGAKARGGKLRLRKVPRGVIVQPQTNGVTTGPVPGGPIKAAEEDTQLAISSLGALSGRKTQQQEAEEKEAEEKEAAEKEAAEKEAAEKGPLRRTATFTILADMWRIDRSLTRRYPRQRRMFEET